MTGPFTGVVLCGGSSSRMGRDKALLEVGGVPMALRVAKALGAAGAAEVIAVGGDVPSLASLGLATRADDRPGEGPLAATITALSAAAHPLVMVTACDLLWPQAQAIRATVDALGANGGALSAVPVVGGHRQWTHAAWRVQARDTLQAAYDGGERSLRRAGASVRLVEVTGLDPVALRDADEPGDLPDAAGSPPPGR